MLEKGGQRETFPKRLEWFVGREAGLVGGDLEEYAIRIAEIKAPKIEAIYRTARGDSCFREALYPPIVVLCGRAQSEMMDAPGALPGK